MGKMTKVFLWIGGALLVVVGIVLIHDNPLPFPGMSPAESWSLIVDGAGATIAIVGLFVVWYQLYRHRTERRTDSDRQRMELEADHDRRQKQATIEYTSNVRVAWVTARRKLREALGEGKLTHDKVQQIMKQPEIDQQVRDLLGALEELAVGTNIEVFDREVIGMMCSSFLIDMYDDFEAYITASQREQPTYYVEFENLVRYLKDKRKPAPGPKVKGVTAKWPTE